jgi:hypothetical protein
MLLPNTRARSRDKVTRSSRLLRGISADLPLLSYDQIEPSRLLTVSIFLSASWSLYNHSEGRPGWTNQTNQLRTAGQQHPVSRTVVAHAATAVADQFLTLISSDCHDHLDLAMGNECSRSGEGRQVSCKTSDLLSGVDGSRERSEGTLVEKFETSYSQENGIATGSSPQPCHADCTTKKKPPPNPGSQASVMICGSPHNGERCFAKCQGTPVHNAPSPPTLMTAAAAAAATQENPILVQPLFELSSRPMISQTLISRPPPFPAKNQFLTPDSCIVQSGSLFLFPTTQPSSV